MFQTKLINRQMAKIFLKTIYVNFQYKNQFLILFYHNVQFFFYIYEQLNIL